MLSKVFTARTGSSIYGSLNTWVCFQIHRPAWSILVNRRCSNSIYVWWTRLHEFSSAGLFALRRTAAGLCHYLLWRPLWYHWHRFELSCPMHFCHQPFNCLCCFALLMESMAQNRLYLVSHSIYDHCSGYRVYLTCIGVQETQSNASDFTIITVEQAELCRRVSDLLLLIDRFCTIPYINLWNNMCL